MKTGISILVCACSITLGSAARVQGQGTPAGAPSSGPTVAHDQIHNLAVEAGKAVLVDTPNTIERIAVGTSDIAEATAISPTEIMVNGKAIGETSLILWQQGGGRQFFNVQVRPSEFATNDKLDGIRRELSSELPGQAVRVSAEGGNIFLRGTVKDLTSSDRAMQIAATGGKVVNLLYVDVPKAEPQILLKVRFASLDRSRTNQLGLNVFSTGAGNSIGSATTQQFSPPSLGSTGLGGGAPAQATLSNLLNLFIFRPDINLGATLQALETDGTVQVLAEPNVLTMNGKQGSILAGGQYPYPVVQGVTGGGGSGAVTIAFKEFGVRLNFIPTITPRGTIRLQVSPEVSSLDLANGVTISGFTVPGLDIRRVKTEVELSEGESFALGGLLDNRETETFEKIPFIGDVPILGKFFQSISKTKNNTELIVIVTPELVNPIPAGAPQPQINFPKSFLPLDAGGPMNTPENEPILGGGPETIPVEKLQESMKPEQQLTDQTGSASSGGGGGQTGAGGGGTP